MAHQKLIINGGMAALVQGSGARFGGGWRLVNGGGMTSGSDGDWTPAGHRLVRSSAEQRPDGQDGGEGHGFDEHRPQAVHQNQEPVQPPLLCGGRNKGSVTTATGRRCMVLPQKVEATHLGGGLCRVQLAGENREWLVPLLEWYHRRCSAACCAACCAAGRSGWLCC